MDLDTSTLILFDFDVDKELQEVAFEVVQWGQECLENEMFPREDYRELLELTVLFLGGSVFPFSFRKPGMIFLSFFPISRITIIVYLCLIKELTIMHASWRIPSTSFKCSCCLNSLE